jgi:hypothetical protein
VCIFCAKADSDWTATSRQRALELLARLERPDGLSHDDALRLSARLLSWTESGRSSFRCEAAIAAVSTDRDLSDERSA